MAEEKSFGDIVQELIKAKDEEIAGLKADNEKLRKAIEPFEKYNQYLNDNGGDIIPDEATIYSTPPQLWRDDPRGNDCPLTIGELRNLVAAKEG